MLGHESTLGCCDVAQREAKGPDFCLMRAKSKCAMFCKKRFHAQ